MHILLLCEGNAETWDCWSGTAKSLVDQLRQAGHTVGAGDVALYGRDRWIAAAATFALDRRRWGVRYRLMAEPFRRRTRRADLCIPAHGRDFDLILQIGATFRPPRPRHTPYVLYCDSNIREAERGIGTGHSPARWLRPDEVRAVIEREAAVYRGASAIFTISERLRRSFLEDFEIPAERVCTVHAGPNFDITRIPPDDALAARAAAHPPTILFVGAQFERKGGDTLVRAFRRVRETIPNAQLRIVGPESLRVADPGVECLGFLSKGDPAGWAQIVDAYASADVFCLPTRFEPFGIAFLEAMYFGLPCIGPDAWAIPEMITHDVTGLTFPVDDVEALTACLLRLLRDRELARQMGRAGRARAASYFTWRAVVDRIVAVVEPLVHQRRHVS